MNYYTDIPKEYNVSVQVFDDLWMDLYDLFKNLRIYLKKKDSNHGHHVNLTLQRDGKLNVSFDYIDWANSEFGQMGREHYYMYKNLEFGLKRICHKLG